MLLGSRMESPTPMHEGPTSPSASAQAQRRPSRHGSILLDVVVNVASGGAARGGAIGAFGRFSKCLMSSLHLHMKTSQINVTPERVVHTPAPRAFPRPCTRRGIAYTPAPSLSLSSEEERSSMNSWELVLHLGRSVQLSTHPPPVHLLTTWPSRGSVPTTAPVEGWHQQPVCLQPVNKFVACPLSVSLSLHFITRR
jgi:hypothetical protein